MIEFTRPELQGIKNIILQVREDHPQLHRDKELKIILCKLEIMIDDLTIEPPKSFCKCNDKYHPNGAMCL
jgi:hypothetical protein